MVYNSSSAACPSKQPAPKTRFARIIGRVARTMLELGDHFGQEVAPGRIVIRQKIGQNDLAAMAGIARENLTRVLNDWSATNY
jgi:CRP-like cAMP-binding protein